MLSKAVDCSQNNLNYKYYDGSCTKQAEERIQRKYCNEGNKVMKRSIDVVLIKGINVYVNAIENINEI